MKELVRHIEILLLDHDCVVLPQIGGFVTRNTPAKYIEEEHLFLPPIRTVGFNERLKNDDGLLLQSYMSAYRCSATEAKAMLGEQIRSLQQELWENGMYDLGSIGVLTMDEHNGVQFSPCQAGTVCPSYYGLDALLFAPLQKITADEVTEAVEMPLPDSAGKPCTDKNAWEMTAHGEITIRLKKSWLHNIAAVAAVVMLFFLVSPDAQNTSVMSGEQAEFSRMMWMPIAQETTPVVVSEPQKMPESTQDIPEEPTTEVPAEKLQPEEPEIATEVTGGYCVVMVSAITEKNAENYVNRLHKNGYKEAQVYKKGKMIRVIFPGFATEAEAHARMRALSDSSEEFAYAWVHQIK